jgi:hypothetical protein
LLHPIFVKKIGLDVRVFGIFSMGVEDEILGLLLRCKMEEEDGSNAIVPFDNGPRTFMSFQPFVFSDSIN